MEGAAAAVVSTAAGVASKEAQTGLKTSAQTFMTGSMAAPGFAKAMWPQGSADSQAFQEAQLDTMLDQARTQIGDTLNSGLGVLMSDVQSFTQFAGYGRYSGQVPLSVPQQTDDLSLSLKTFLTGESLLQNSWFANAGPSPTTPNRNDLNQWSKCSNQGPGIFSCGGQAYYSSTSTGRYYALRNKKDGSKNSVNILQQISSNGWADMNVLFDGSYNCTSSGECSFFQPLVEVSRL